MARDVASDTYYITSGGKIPLKWTAPEVYSNCMRVNYNYVVTFQFRQFFIRSIQHRVMYGVLGVYCMKYGVWDISHLKILMVEQRYTYT